MRTLLRIITKCITSRRSMDSTTTKYLELSSIVITINKFSKLTIAKIGNIYFYSFFNHSFYRLETNTSFVQDYQQKLEKK